MKRKALFKLLVVLPVAFLTVSVGAQDSNFNWDALGENSNRLEGKLTGTIYYLPPLETSKHFFYEGWKEGTVLLEDADIFTGLRLSYLARGDELVIYNPNLRQLFIADKEKVKSFTVQLLHEEHKFVKLYYDAIFGGHRYFQLLYDGTRKFLAYHYVYEEKISVYRDEQGKLRDTRLKLKTNYYLYSSDTGFKNLQTKRRSFVRLFPENKREVRRIFRRNKLRIFNESEMVRAFQVLDDAGFFD